jgi:hypothetical protein
MAASTGDTAVPRVERILQAFRECRYSIHDLSRYQGEGAENLARFNMPLELGMAMALRGLEPDADSHDWLVMVPDGHLYERYISDLGGFDPAIHDGSPERIAIAVLSWLVTRPDAYVAIGPDELLPHLRPYLTAKRQLDDDWGGSPPWARVLELAVEVASRS